MAIFFGNRRFVVRGLSGAAKAAASCRWIAAFFHKLRASCHLAATRELVPFPVHDFRETPGPTKRIPVRLGE